jgi:hypothetical protein
MQDDGRALHAVAARIRGAHDFSMHVGMRGVQPVSTTQPSSLMPRQTRTTSHAVASRAFVKTSHAISCGADSVHGRFVQFDRRTKHFPFD